MSNLFKKGSLPQWRFWLALLLQLGIVLLIPARQALTLATGTTIYLQTAPLDPYDLLRGRYVTLGYVVDRRSTLEQLPGWSSELDRPGILYLRLAPSGGDPTQPWQAIGVSRDMPKDVKPEEKVLRGRFDGWRLKFGIEEFFIPEAVGDVLEEDIRRYPEATRAEVKVDPWGKAALIGLWVRERRY
ncbi:GDYXXLXY domain-containing protein [Synechococcus sp. H55.7]|uniref:GDYXXLXY domain-containing protein n=1 Tax=unclassified Synechococcus TaxID=2626047 RepID=UPI0039C293D1